MEVVFVAGFFNPVKRVLEEEFPEQLAGGTLVWIRQIGPGREARLIDLRERLFDRLAKGASRILIILAVLKGHEFVLDSVRGLVNRARSEYPNASIDLAPEKNAGNGPAIIRQIASVGLAVVPAITEEALSRRLGEQRVLCVFPTGRTSFRKAFEQVGLQEDVFNRYFEERHYPPGEKNSNLIGRLKAEALSHKGLLYAWKGLKTLPANVKRRFTLCSYEAEHAHKVVAIFKRWLAK